MTALVLLYHLESIGCQLKAEGDHIRFRAPGGVLSDGQRLKLKEHKLELLELLQLRRKFSYPEAALFQLIGHSVTTLQGSGVLLSVFRRYCRVALQQTGSVVQLRPAELISLAVAEFGEAVAA